MITPTLFDLAVIAGLRPTGVNYEPTKNDFDFRFSSGAYNPFIEEHRAPVILSMLTNT